MQELYSFQKQAISSLLSPKTRHVICISPTGSGKTKIVEKWIEHTQKRTLFISPLIALNQQQEKRFQLAGFSKLIEVKTPESATHESFRSSLDLFEQFVVDECHTVFEWGESFRPALAELPKLFSNKKTLWLTATLSTTDVKRLALKLSGSVKVLGRFSFSEKIRLETITIPWHERLSFIQYLATHYRTGMGIVFCNSRQWCERIDRYLKAVHLSSAYYHAGLSKEEKQNVESQIKSGEIKILVSTIAFGLGMHVPEISWGVSWGFPGSFLSLSQMIGRVGRCEHGGVFYFLWSKEDEMVWNRKKSDSKINLEELGRLVHGLSHGHSIRKIIESELI